MTTTLRAFCAPPLEREQIYVYDLARGWAFKTSIANVAVTRHFYTLGLDRGQPSYVVEEALSRLESDVKPILARMIETEELVKDQDRRRVLAIFIATLFMRTRQGLQTVHGHREEVRTGSAPSEAQLPSSYAKDLLGLDDEGMRELFAKAVVAKAAKLSSLLDAMHWRLLRAKGNYLITSENPLVIYHDSEERWGLGTPGAHIHLPLSPRLVLHVSKDPIIPGAGTFDLPTAGVRGLNGLTVLSAEQYLFSHTDFDQVPDLLRDRAPGARREFSPPRPVPSDNEGI